MEQLTLGETECMEYSGAERAPTYGTDDKDQCKLN